MSKTNETTTSHVEGVKNGTYNVRLLGETMPFIVNGKATIAKLADFNMETGGLRVITAVTHCIGDDKFKLKLGAKVALAKAIKYLIRFRRESFEDSLSEWKCKYNTLVTEIKLANPGIDIEKMK